MRSDRENVEKLLDECRRVRDLLLKDPAYSQTCESISEVIGEVSGDHFYRPIESVIIRQIHGRGIKYTYKHIPNDKSLAWDMYFDDHELGVDVHVPTQSMRVYKFSESSGKYKMSKMIYSSTSVKSKEECVNAVLKALNSAEPYRENLRLQGLTFSRRLGFLIHQLTQVMNKKVF